MTSLPDRPQTALLVIDVQNDVVDGAHNRDAAFQAHAGVQFREPTVTASRRDLHLDML